MAETADMILPLLREMRAEMQSFRSETGRRFDRMHLEMASMEQAQRSVRHAPMGDSSMSKLVTGEFDDRIAALEKQARDQKDAS